MRRIMLMFGLCDLGLLFHGSRIQNRTKLASSVASWEQLTFVYRKASDVNQAEMFTDNVTI